MPSSGSLAQVRQRRALVWGFQEYESFPDVRFALEDAEDLAGCLEKLHFTVDVGTNLTRCSSATASCCPIHALARLTPASKPQGYGRGFHRELCRQVRIDKSPPPLSLPLLQTRTNLRRPSVRIFCALIITSVRPIQDRRRRHHPILLRGPRPAARRAQLPDHEGRRRRTGRSLPRAPNPTADDRQGIPTHRRGHDGRLQG